MNDPIDSRQLQIFLRLAAEGSLKTAAAQLFLTTSAIPSRIWKQIWGVKLFHRSGRGLVLTPRGEFLARKGGPALAQLCALRRQLADETVNERTPFRVAAGHSYVSGLLLEVTSEFLDCFQRVTLHVQAAEREECLRLVRGHEVEGAIVVDPPPDDSECIVSKLFSDRLLLTMNARHPLSALERVPSRQLNEQILIVSRASSYTNRTLQDQITRHGVKFRDVMEVGSVSGVIEMVRTGVGVAVIPDGFVTLWKLQDWR
ncbi:MAG: LysR family transcriptional regulator [Candidatus Synoicihabitans palmerolidicus]|nr:LysR family transcriptional regulator [Candidatus Synoicihabitans palmerolidicus]